MSAVQIIEFIPEVTANEYAETVAALAETPGSAAVITVATADAPKHATRFAKAANAAGHGARKRATVDNEDGTTSITFTLGQMRGTGKVEGYADTDSLKAEINTKHGKGAKVEAVEATEL